MSRFNNGQCNSKSKERELDRIRHEWMLEQERAREHERRKQKMIREYEEKRAHELGLKKHNRRSSKRSHSRSRSHSPSTSTSRARPTDIHKSHSTKNLVMSQKCEPSSSNTRLFKGPEGTKILVSDLKKIKVDIQRQINVTEQTSELQRNIINPDEVVLKRRDGEGSKPIFERDELKKSNRTDVNEEIPERRTVVTVNSAVDSRRRSVSTSPERRHRNRSPRHDSRYNNTPSRNVGDRVHHERRNSEQRHRSRDRSREVRDRYNKDTRHSSSKSCHERSRNYKRRRSHSEERDNRPSSRRDSSAYEYSRHDTCRRRYEDERLRDRRIQFPPHHYLEPVPVPFYYGNYARPIMVDPLMAMRDPIGIGRGRMPPMIGPPVRPRFPPRFIPPVIFRPHGPPNPRF